MKKKIFMFFCVTCISVTVIAQSGVRIGNLEFVVKKATSDSIAQFVENPCPPCPSENEVRPKPKKTFKPYTSTEGFAGIGFIIPDNSAGYYTILGGNSINIDLGCDRQWHFTRWFAVGTLMQYSFYNYRLRDAAADPVFFDEIIREEALPTDIKKQLYRSHNLAVGLFTRFYVSPATIYRRLFLDLGIQGDFAFGRHYRMDTRSNGKQKYHESYAFNPFSASAFTRIGLGKDFAIYARYRFTDLYNKKVLPMDLPPITVGVQFW